MFGNFVAGRTYIRRRDIHARFRGQQQGGISTPADHPVIFLFTGSSGTQHGYNDGWQPDGSFRYFGEGQTGDMQWRAGNKAVGEHAAAGKELLLFETLRKGGEVRFLGSFVCASHDTVNAPDSEGSSRQAIVFDLVNIDAVSSGDDDEVRDVGDASVDLIELRRAAYDAARPVAGSRLSDAVRTIYQRSATIKQYILARAKGECEGCGSPAPFIRPNGDGYLEPHHIRRVSDGGPDDPKAVIALCPNCHREAHFGIRREQLRRMHMNIVANKELDDNVLA